MTEGPPRLPAELPFSATTLPEGANRMPQEHRPTMASRSAAGKAGRGNAIWL
jgi:hypothetical protein